MVKRSIAQAKFGLVVNSNGEEMSGRDPQRQRVAVLAMEKKKTDLLQDARKSARWFMDKYRSIGELADAVAAIEGFLERTA